MLDRILNTVLHKWYGYTKKTCIVCRTMFDINMTIMERSTCQAAFCKQDVIKNFTKFNRNKCSRCSFLIKSQAPGLQLCVKRNSGTGIFL